MAKRRDEPYRAGKRGWRKVRTRATRDAVIAGVFGSLERPEALILGAYDQHGQLRVIARTGMLAPAARAELGGPLRPPVGAHPWPATLLGSRLGALPGERLTYTRCNRNWWWSSSTTAPHHVLGAILADATGTLTVCITGPEPSDQR